jgi:hypothetical protein
MAYYFTFVKYNVGPNGSSGHGGFTEALLADMQDRRRGAASLCNLPAASGLRTPEIIGKAVPTGSGARL